jgi:hypothetical protein
VCWVVVVIITLILNRCPTCAKSWTFIALFLPLVAFLSMMMSIRLEAARSLRKTSQISMVPFTAKLRCCRPSPTRFSQYSVNVVVLVSQGFLEEMLKSYKTTMVLRLRMPVSDDLEPRNFVTKIARYDKVVNIPNSMTVLSDLLPAALKMSEAKLVGIFNFCNPGAISHNEVLDMYKEIIDPTFLYSNFSVEEQNKILAAKRSNNELDATKLNNALARLKCPVPEIHDAFRKCFHRMKANLVAKYGNDYSAFLPKKMSQSK